MIHILGKSKLSSQRIFCRHGGVAKVSLDKLLHHLVGLENRKCASKKQNKNKKKRSSIIGIGPNSKSEVFEIYILLVPGF